MAKASKRNSRTLSTAAKLTELGFAAPQVVAHRLTRMVLAGPVISARDRKEFAGMVGEKQAAVAQAWIGMFTEGVRLQQQVVLSLLTSATPSQHVARAKSAASRMASAGLSPFHRKAVANAKRLGRTKLR